MWSLSGNASEFNSDGLILIVQPSFELYQLGGNTLFEAGAAQVDSVSKCFVFSSNVMCLQPDDSVIQAQHLCFDAVQDTLEVSKGFSMKMPSMVLRGEDAILDRASRKIEVEGAVQVEIWRE